MSNKKSRKKHSAKSLGDVTLNDFANSAVSKSRPKKASSVTQVLKKLEEEKSWDEKDFEGEFVEEENEDGTVSMVIRKIEPRRRKKTNSNSEDSNISGFTYPIDVWFILSEYIRPEDVGRFAGICKTSFDVVCTAKFWFGMYRRYYKSVPNLPEQLQPECLVRKYRLRSSVIRALHYMYQPFANRIKAVTTFEEHPDSLIKRQCVLMWHKRDSKKQWVYYFKMKEKIDCFLKHSRNSHMHQLDLLEILDDVSANEDEHCRILQITCKHFIVVPVVLGYTLTSVSLTLSQGFRHHRLQMGFGSGVNFNPRIIDGSSSASIILDPVINVKVLDWWHPLYPHTHKMEHLLNQE